MAQIFVSTVAHFFVSASGSKFHERMAHFFIDIYKWKVPVEVGDILCQNTGKKKGAPSLESRYDDPLFFTEYAKMARSMVRRRS